MRGKILSAKGILLTILVLFSVSYLLLECSIQEVFAASKPTSSYDPANIEVFTSLNSGHRVSNKTADDYSRPTDKTVYLTFDDGPSPYTEEVLNLLKEKNIQATFFVMGIQAEQHPELVQRIVEDGHSLGNHTYNHNYESLYSDFDEFWDQIKKTEDILKELTGETTHLIRAAGGTYRHFDVFYHYYLESAGYEVHDWNIDSGDSKRVGVPKNEIIENVKNSPLSHEVNLLLHDGRGHKESVKALPEIIDYFQAQGYVFAPLTKKVKPVQHSIGNLKWEQEYSLTGFVQSWQAISGVNVSVSKTDLLQVAVASSKVTTNPLPLYITYEDKPAAIEHADYKFRNNRFYVPVRKWQEQQGNEVTWDATTKTVTIEHKNRKTRLNTLKQTFISSTNTETLMQEQPIDLFIEHGTLYVALRDMMDIDRYEVSDYTLTMDRQEIFVRAV